MCDEVITCIQIELLRFSYTISYGNFSTSFDIYESFIFFEAKMTVDIEYFKYINQIFSKRYQSFS